MKKAEVSLKGRGDIWSGLDRQSEMTPGEGAFYDLRNCYVSKDGTELRRIPGWKPVAQPQFSEPLSITNFSSGSNTTITTSANHGLTDVGGAPGSKVYLSGLPGIADGEYTVDSVGSASAFTINESSTGSSTTGTVYADRLRYPHGFKQVMGRTVVVGEDVKWIDVTAYTALDVIEGDPTTVFVRGMHGYEPGETFEVTVSGSSGSSGFNATWTATAVTVNSFTVPHDSTSDTITGTTLAWTARKSHLAAWVETDELSATSAPQFAEYWPSVTSSVAFTNLEDFWPIRRKSVLDVADGKVLIASPGYGCCWQVDIRHLDYSTSILDYVYCLGMPKGGLVTASSPGGSPLFTNLTVNYVAVAYRNSATGEIGLISEPWDLSSGATRDAAVTFVRAREMLREAPVYHDILVFGGTSPASMKLLYVEDGDASSGRGDSGSQALNTGTCPDDGVTARIPFLEQMPQGSKFIRTVRGFTLGGGSLGALGDAFSVDEVRTISQDGSGLDNEEVQVAVNSVNVGGWVLPTSYQGIRINNPPSNSMEHTRLDIHRRVKNVSSEYFHVWDTEDPLQNDTGGVQSYLLYDRGSAWFSEPGEPGVAPSTNRLIFDTRNGEDLEGAGPYRNGWVVCSETESFLLSAGQSPLGQRPVRVSSQYGCVAPNSFVEFEGGTAWLSRRGPVLFNGGGVEWIGRSVQPLFDTCLTDSRAMMPHAIVGHDSRRGLIYWGLRRDTEDSDYADISTVWPDDQRSKVPCDYFLVYSYRTRAWSTWEPPSSVGGVWWMDTVTTDERTDELAFLAGADWNAKLYVFDDDYGDGVAHSGITMGMAADTSWLQAAGTTTDFKPSDANTIALLKAGMSYFVVDGETVYYGDGQEIASVDTENQTITLASPIPWTTTARVYAGILPMRIKSKLTSLNPRARGKSTVTNITSRYTADGDSTHMLSQIGGSGFHRDTMTTYRSDGKFSEQAEEQQAIIDIVGNGVTRLKDVWLEAAESG